MRNPAGTIITRLRDPAINNHGYTYYIQLATRPPHTHYIYAYTHTTSVRSLSAVLSFLFHSSTACIHLISPMSGGAHSHVSVFSHLVIHRCEILLRCSNPYQLSQYPSHQLSRFLPLYKLDRVLTYVPSFINSLSLWPSGEPALLNARI